MRQHRSEPVPLEPVPEPLRPLMAAGMAKDPGRRPADATVLVAELGRSPGGAYGPDWEDRGRSVLAAAALLLAALWPSGAPPRRRAAAVHRISLRRRLPHRHIGTVKAAIAGGAAIAVVASPRVASWPGRPATRTATSAGPSMLVHATSTSVDLRTQRVRRTPPAFPKGGGVTGPPGSARCS